MNKDAALAPSSHQHLPSATAPSLVPIVRVGAATSNFGTYQPEADICEGFRDITRMHEKQGARSTTVQRFQRPLGPRRGSAPGGFTSRQSLAATGVCESGTLVQVV